MKTSIAGVLWFGGWGVAICGDPRAVAYHRVCCQQDAALKVQFDEELIPAVENLVEQFDSDFCIHTLGIRSAVRDKRGGVWPHATHDPARGFETHFTPTSSAVERGRSKSSKKNAHSDLKCAHVEVFFKEADSPTCDLELFTPKYMADVSMLNPTVRIGTGEGTWNGETIIDYVEKEDRLSLPNMAFPADRSLISSFDRCNSIISRPMIESAVKSLGTSLDPKAVVRFLEYATNSRVPISNIFLRNNEREGAMTIGKLQKLDFAETIADLCQAMGRKNDASCLKSVKTKYLIPKYAREDNPPAVSRSTSKSSSRQQTKSSVKLAPLGDAQIQQRLIKLIIPTHKSVESRICDLHREARMLDFVLMRAFLAVSGTSYAELHHPAMQKRLSTKRHWMLAACASGLDPTGESGTFLNDHFSFALKGSGNVNFMTSAVLENVDTQGLTSPICAVIAGGKNVLRLPEAEVEFWIAYFTRDKDGNDEVFRSNAGKGNLWEHFDMEGGDLEGVLRSAAFQIRQKGRS